MRSLREQINHSERKIAELTAKENKCKNRRQKEEQKLKPLLRRLNARRDSLQLTALRHLLENDPDVLAKLRNTLDQLDLSNEDRALVDLPPKPKDNLGAATDVPGSGSDTPSPTPRSRADNSGKDALPAGNQDRTPAASPDSTGDAAAATPSSPTSHVDGDAAPSQPMARAAATSASPEPGDKPTEKQLKFLKDLIAKYPDKAQKIGIDSESLSTLSKQKVSWAIQQLAPPRNATSQTPNRRGGNVPSAAPSRRRPPR